MRTIFICALLWISSSFAQSQIVPVKSQDSLLGHKVITDKNNRLLSWYKPEIPGAGFEHVVKLAAEFIRTGIPTDAKTGKKLYFVTCCFDGPQIIGEENWKQGKGGSFWPHNPACFYAGMVQSLAVRYFPYTGDSSWIALVREMLDYQINHGTTPSHFKWPGVPYASSDPFETEYQGATLWETDGFRGDGLHGIEPDKVGELGYAYVRFFEITGEKKYLDAAIRCADALAANIYNPVTADNLLLGTDISRSPWPFRINARTGAIISPYSSDVLEPVKLLDELLRIKELAGLNKAQDSAYQNARDVAWNWLFSRYGPVVTYIWNGYFEDVPNDPELANRVQITPGELAKYLILHQNDKEKYDLTIRNIIYWIRNSFADGQLDGIREQTWCYETMGSHSARYGSLCALYYENTGDPWFREEAYHHLNYATYMCWENGVVSVGHRWPGSWFSDGYSDYIRHLLDALAAVPEWVPPGEDHLLRSSSIIRSIQYEAKLIRYSTFDISSSEKLVLSQKPKLIKAGDRVLPEKKVPTENSWVWRPLKTGGVSLIHHSMSGEISIQK